MKDWARLDQSIEIPALQYWVGFVLFFSLFCQMLQEPAGRFRGEFGTIYFKTNGGEGAPCLIGISYLNMRGFVQVGWILCTFAGV